MRYYISGITISVVVLREFAGENEFSIMQDEIKEAFDKGITETIRCMDKHFKDNIYSIWQLFKDEQRKILDQLSGIDI